MKLTPLLATLVGLLFSLNLLAASAKEEPLDPEFIEFFSMVYDAEFDKADNQLAKVAEKLQIQPDQRAAWDNFSQMIVDNMRMKREHQLEMRDRLKGRLRSMSATEMLQVHLDNLAFQQNEAERALNALLPLYEVLLPDQKMAMDKLLKHLWAKERQRKMR